MMRQKKGRGSHLFGVLVKNERSTLDLFYSIISTASQSLSGEESPHRILDITIFNHTLIFSGFFLLPLAVELFLQSVLSPCYSPVIEPSILLPAPSSTRKYIQPGSKKDYKSQRGKYHRRGVRCGPHGCVVLQRQ